MRDGRLSNTIGADFCVEALEEALARYGKPEIFNTDQGSQFTSQAIITVPETAEAKISMDGRGRCLDNIFSERLWRSLKHEAAYLQELADGAAARRVIGSWIAFYNTERPHWTLAGRTSGQSMAQGPSRGYVDKVDALPTYPQAQQQHGLETGHLAA